MPDTAPADQSHIDVVDFRRRNLILRWRIPAGTWTACEFPPPRVHGVALINPAGPNICIYGHGGRLTLQIGPTQYPLEGKEPRIMCRSGFVLLGLRRRFLIKSGTGALLYSHRYWRGQGRDFFRWFAGLAADSDWRATSARQWSDGVAPASLLGQQSG